MTDVGDSYAKVHINRIELSGLTAKEAPYFTLFVGDHRFSSDAHEKEDINKGRWNINFTFEVSELKEFSASELKIVVHRKDKWKKDKVIGEHSIKLPAFLKSSIPTTEQNNAGLFHCTDCLISRTKKRSSTSSVSSSESVIRAVFYIEVTGWKITYDLLNDKETVPIAISTLSSLAENKSNKKIKSYLRKEILLVLKNLMLDDSIKIRNQIANIWGSLAKRDDESLLLLVKESAIQYIAELLSNVSDIPLQVLLIENLKYFFKYASHQKIMIECGILKILLLNLVKDNSVVLQTKCFEVLLHFDTIHQEEMIKEGIIPILNSLLFSSNNQIQTRSLALIQYFDIIYQDRLVEEGMISNIMILLNSNNSQPLLQLKCLSVLQHFTSKFKDIIVNNGILNNLSTLIYSNNSQLQLKSFQVIENLAESHQLDIVKTGILHSLIHFLNDPNFGLKLECLTILRSFDIDSCIKEGLLLSLNNLLHSNNEAVMIKVLEIIANMNTIYQDKLQESGILSTLVSLLNSSVPLSVSDISFVPASSIPIQSSSSLNILKNDDFYESILKGEDFEYVNSNSKWSCSACTFLNEDILDSCSICGTPKPDDIPSITQDIIKDIPSNVVENTDISILQQEEEEVQEQKENNEVEEKEEEEEEEEEDIEATKERSKEEHIQQEAKWACSACTFLNDEDPLISSCIICNTPKPLPPQPTSSTILDPILSPDTTSTIVTTVDPVNTLSITTLSVPLKCKIFQALRSFEAKYQKYMIEASIIATLKSLLLSDTNMDTQKELVKTISYFTLEHQNLLVKDGILTLLIYLLSPKNAKIFLIVIQMFSGYQEYIIENQLLGCILKLLSFEDVQLQARIADFLMSFEDKYVKEVCNQIKETTSVSTDDTTSASSTSASKCDFCTDCGRVKGHLSNCITNVFSVNYTLQSQAKKLLWQFEHDGIRILKYGIVYNDGGSFSRKYKVKNILTANSSVYSSQLQPTVNIVLQYKGQGIPYASHLIMKAPRTRFDSPLKTAIVFINDNQVPDLKSTLKYDKLTDSQWEEIKKLGIQYTGPNTCIIPLDLSDNYYTEIPLLKPTKASYIHIKLLSASKQNFDVEYMGVVGISLLKELSPLEFPALDPKVLTDVGNYLGVKKRVKRFEYSSDFDKNGLLYWIGSSSEIEKSHWQNPVVSGQVALSTSHPMYSGNMKMEDIVSRDGGNSCYWGGSCPQYFTIDLKQRRLRCNYFTLRHGYQAANSYIQNWSFSCSNDLVHWTILYEGGETPFNKAFDTKSWPVHDGKEFCRYFRVLQKGNYSMGRGITGGGSAYLCISGFEIYGDLLLD